MITMVGGIDAIKPAGMGWLVTPSDSTEFNVETRYIYVGGTGDLVAWMWNPEIGKWDAITFANIPTGAVLAIQTKKIMAATTATDITAMA